jgi:hypothetical protein
MNQGDYIFLGLAGVLLLISLIGWVSAVIDEKKNDR